MNRSYSFSTGIYWLTVISLAVLIGLLTFRALAAAAPVDATFPRETAAAGHETKETQTW